MTDIRLAGFLAARLFNMYYGMFKNHDNRNCELKTSIIIRIQNKIEEFLNNVGLMPYHYLCTFYFT